MTTKLILEGPMRLWSQEGGHAAPDLEIADTGVAGAIEDMFPEAVDKQVPGTWRLTLEKID